MLRGTNLIFKYNLSPLSSLKFNYLYLIIFNNNCNHSQNFKHFFSDISFHVIILKLLLTSFICVCSKNC